MSDSNTTANILAALRGMSGNDHVGQTAIRAAEVIERLRSGIQAMLDGDYPHPRSYRSAPGMQCPHGIIYYEECSQCNDAWLQGLLK